jgi:hypothetical protein
MTLREDPLEGRARGPRRLCSEEMAERPWLRPCGIGCVTVCLPTMIFTLGEVRRSCRPLLGATHFA